MSYFALPVSWKFEAYLFFSGKDRWSQNAQDVERAEYAHKNPWVLKYDFGHKELIKRLEDAKRRII